MFDRNREAIHELDYFEWLDANANYAKQCEWEDRLRRHAPATDFEPYDTDTEPEPKKD